MKINSSQDQQAWKKTNIYMSSLLHLLILTEEAINHLQFFKP